MTTTGSQHFHHKNQNMEFVMNNDMFKLEQEVLQYEEFLSATDADDGYFAELNEVESVTKVFITSQL